MVKFIFSTQTNRSTTFLARRLSYTITQDCAFEVSEPEDIAFFDSNPRFHRVIISPPKPVVEEEKIEVNWLKELEDIWGIDKKLAKKIHGKYPTKKELIETMEEGYDLGVFISEKKQDLLYKHFNIGETE